MTTARAKDAAMVAFGLLVIIVDQLTKHWVQDYFTAHPFTVVPVIGNILTLVYDQNTGIAFSFFSGQASLYLLIAVAIGVIGYLYWRTRETAPLLLKVSFGLVLGGAIGNLIDRIAHQYVVDFIHFQIPAIGFDFAIFNIADSAISIGVVMLAWMLWVNGMGAKQPDTPTPPDGASTTSTTSTTSAPTNTDATAQQQPVSAKGTRDA